MRHEQIIKYIIIFVCTIAQKTRYHCYNPLKGTKHQSVVLHYMRRIESYFKTLDGNIFRRYPKEG